MQPILAQVNNVTYKDAYLDLGRSQSVLSASSARVLLGTTHTSPCTVVVTAGLKDETFMTPLTCQVDPCLDTSIVLGSDWHDLYRVFKQSSEEVRLAHCLRDTPVDGVHTSAPPSDDEYILSLFTEIPKGIEQLLYRHGIGAEQGSLESSVSALYHHLLYGLCHFRIGEDCPRVAGDFHTKADVITHVLEVVTAFNGGPSFTAALLGACNAIGARARLGDSRQVLSVRLRHQRDSLILCPTLDLERVFVRMKNLDRADLLSVAAAHGLSYFGPSGSVEDSILKHILTGECASVVQGKRRTFTACHISNRDKLSKEELKNSNIRRVLGHLSKHQLMLLCLQNQISVRDHMSVTDIRDNILTKLRQLDKGKERQQDAGKCLGDVSLRTDLLLEDLQRRQRVWPQPVKHLDKQIRKLFREATSSRRLAEVVCASCAERIMSDEADVILGDSIDLSPLKKPAYAAHFPTIPEPHDISSLEGICVEPQGVSFNEEKMSLTFCSGCLRDIRNNKVPPLSLANRTWLGAVPAELEGLTVVEEALVARCRSRAWILQLKDDKKGQYHQRGLRGHIIIYPQRPETVLDVLPPPLDDVVQPVAVIFVGDQRPTDEWLRQHASPLVVRAERVRSALLWLQEHNHLYRDVVIDHDAIDSLPKNGILPVNLDVIGSTSDVRASAGSYVTQGSAEEVDTVEETPVFQNLVIADVDVHAPLSALKIAAVRHVFDKKKPFLQVPRGSSPENEFHNPYLFPNMYPTLFPYGVGGFEDGGRLSPLSAKRHAKHLFSLADRRFQEHYSFLFTVFNMLQRRSVLTHTNVRVNRRHCRSVLEDFDQLTPEAIHRVTERISRGDYCTVDNDDEKRVLRVMKEIHAANNNVPGTTASKVQMRREIHALTMHLGMPSLFITINPADIYNPVVKFLAGSSIDVDQLTADMLPSYMEQSALVAKNPFVVARFFNLYMKSFIRCILGWQNPELSEGIFGRVSGYYGCVEAQGRGSLHCHLLVWLEDSLNPTEIQEILQRQDDPLFCERLMTYLDEIVSNDLPEPVTVEVGDDDAVRVNPCRYRDKPDATDIEQEDDLASLVSTCQVHRHGDTCYKYYKGVGPKECRFGLDEDNGGRAVAFDPGTGEITMKQDNGMVNNFNRTMLRSLCCNMDIKYIGSGVIAKALMYYITDYITKPGTSSYVAYLALEATLRQCEANGVTEIDDALTRYKKIYQKCVFGQLAQQELSSQQVATYLMDYGDNYTSHKFRKLFWSAAEDRLKASIESGDMQEPEVELCATEDVVLSITDKGLVPRTDQLSDYLDRPRELDYMNLWDFVSCTEKEKIAGRPEASSVWDHLSYRELLDNDGHTRPRLRFLSTHPEHDRYYLKIVHPDSRYVPEVVGAVPRRDLVYQQDQYMRTMLVLFSPWRRIKDLCDDTLPDKFQDMYNTSELYHLRVMENMQVLHECRDSRDRDFERRFKKGSAVSPIMEAGRDAMFTDCLEGAQEGSVLSSVEMYLRELCVAKTRQNPDSDASACVSAAESAGCLEPSIGCEVVYNVGAIEQVLETDLRRKNAPESKWKAAYRSYEDALKKRLRGDYIQNAGWSLSQVDPSGATVRQLDGDDVFEDSVNRGEEISLDIDEPLQYFVSKYTLNKKQALAFALIAAHVVNKDLPPLRMYLGGPAGTGKTLVIQAVQELFRQRQESRRLRLSSYMGIAARNIRGCTLHSLLQMSINKDVAPRSRKRIDDLQQMWVGVDFLVVDEVSMVSVDLLNQINKALCLAKGNTDLFGGVNIVFAGDFAQLQPVGGKSLFRVYRRSHSTGGTNAGQDVVGGRLLWHSIDKVVLLTESMRQMGAENLRFQQLLHRLRVGACNESDYSLLLSCLLTRRDVLEDPEWKNAMVIVCNNNVKDEMNAHYAMRFAEETGQTLHWYYPQDYVKKVPPSLTVRETLASLDTGVTKNVPGKLPFVLNMPVIVSQNFDVEHGIVNGSIGYLRKIRYFVDADGLRVLSSCIIEIPDAEDVPMPDLPPKHFPVLANRYDVQLSLSNKKRIASSQQKNQTFSFQRYQVPLQPAFCITAHRAQGMTLERAVVDLVNCTGSESPYVMVSRARSIKGLKVLRDFEPKVVSKGLSQDLREEFVRLAAAETNTLLNLTDATMADAVTVSDSGPSQSDGKKRSAENLGETEQEPVRKIKRVRLLL